MDFRSLQKDISNCQICTNFLEHETNPIFRFHPKARIVIIGQAPGRKAHESSIAWNDPSGIRLRQWMDISDETFYQNPGIAIVPMGFCYPGKGKSGDLPPRPECAPKWHQMMLQFMPDLDFFLLIGQYAQRHYLKDGNKRLTDRVKNYKSYLPKFLPLPHPSPRNIAWFKKNPWFEKELLPILRKEIKRRLN
jgi:uracil-DNA glycosylase